jgi:ligand-binding sensor domain-containing protein/signal transduction histidine kinase/AraC-like DNA-binding protein
MSCRSFILPALLFANMVIPAGWLRAQAPSLSFRHIAYEQGLSNATVEAIFQDNRGFIWIGTRDGLNRYDGNEMITFRNNPGDSTSLSDNYIRCIAEDREHALWIGTSDGLNRFNPATKTFTRYKFHAADSKSLGHNAVNALYADKQGLLWIGTDGGGLDLLDESGDVPYRGFVHFHSGARGGLDDDHVNSLYEGPNGDLWIGTDSGLNCLDTRQAVFRPLKDPSGLSRSAIQVIRADTRGNLWLGTSENGLLEYNLTTQTFIPLLHRDKDPSSLAGNQVRSILVDRKGDIWIGGVNAGLNLFRPESRSFYHYQNDPGDPSSLSQRTISALFEDYQGNLWIGTHRGGINVYMPGASKFKRFPERAVAGQASTSLTNNDVRTFYEDPKGVVWIGTDGGGLNVWDPGTGHFSAFRNDPYKPQSLSSDAVLHIMEDHAGNMWISTWEGGLDLFHPSTGTFTRYLHDPRNPRSISSNYVQKTFEDRKGRLWVATYFGGLNLLDPQKGSFSRITGDSASGTRLSGNNVVAIDQDRSGNIWIGTDDGGLTRCDINTGRFTHYFNHGEKSPDLRVIFTDHKGRLWIGQAGLYLYDPARDTFALFTETAGLDHEFIKGMTEDAQGNFWISTGTGLTRFNPDTQSFVKYNKGDGLQGPEFEAGAYLQTRSGEMLFGGTNGFNAFNPADIQKNPYIPPVYITGFQVFNQKLDVGDMTDLIRLSYRQSTFTFTFSALNYTVPENNQYAYKLDGFDNDWHYSGGEHKANYTNLDPGTYVFRVKASNNDGVWNEQGAAIRIIITPPFWKTGWFLLLVTLIVIGSAWFFYRFKRNLELTRLEEKKREEIHRVQLQFFTNISHELRTPLSLILGPVEKLLQTDVPPGIRHYYHSIHRNAQRLMSLINELMDFRKMETGAVTLHVMPGNLSLFLDEIALSFTDWAVEKSIHFSLKTEAGPDQAWFDRQMLEKIVLNLLHNAFKYTGKDGAIVLEVLTSLESFTPSFANELILRNEYRAARYVYIRIADTGIGISGDSIKHLFERYYRISEAHLGSGVGLAFVRSLAQLHKGDILVYSERNKGTEIIVGIPMEESNYADTEKWAKGTAARRVQLESLTLPEEAPASRDQPLLLIVEDNEELRQFLLDSFSPYYKVAEAADGQAGWEKVKEIYPDLIISDVMMPGIDGNTFCRMVKQDIGTSHIPFLMLTAKSAEHSTIEGVESGADAYFTKPVSIDLLLLTIRNILARAQKLKEHFTKDYQVQARELVHSEKDKAFMDTLLETIEAQLINPDLDVDLLCSQLGMSRTKLYQKIKSITGQSIGEFVRTIRLKKAVHIMLHEDVPFTEIMYRIGIQSQSYFTKAFKKEFGKTPTQFLQEMN